MTVQGTSSPVGWDDNNCCESGGGPCAIYDPTQHSAREYIWSKLHAGYYKFGIKVTPDTEGSDSALTEF